MKAIIWPNPQGAFTPIILIHSSLATLETCVFLERPRCADCPGPLLSQPLRTRLQRHKDSAGHEERKDSPMSEMFTGESRVQSPLLPQTPCVTLGKSLGLCASVSHLCHSTALPPRAVMTKYVRGAQILGQGGHEISMARRVPGPHFATRTEERLSQEPSRNIRARSQLPQGCESAESNAHPAS